MQRAIIHKPVPYFGSEAKRASPRRNLMGATNRRQAFSARGEMPPPKGLSTKRDFLGADTRPVPSGAVTVRNPVLGDTFYANSTAHFSSSGGPPPTGGYGGGEAPPPMSATAGTSTTLQQTATATSKLDTKTQAAQLKASGGKIRSGFTAEAKAERVAAYAQGTINEGDLIAGQDMQGGVAPWKALRPEITRPTVLELGPREPAINTDLVRAVGAAATDSLLDRTGLIAEMARKLQVEREEAAKKTTPAVAELERLRRKNQGQTVGTVRKKTVDGHAEAAISVMRDFFSTRPYEILLNVFRDQDKDRSGSIDLDEFKRGLKQLNLNLTDRDMTAVFKAADQDQSGTVDFDEFLNSFRTDSFPREVFFWDKTRPRGLLKREDRKRLAQTLGGGSNLQKKYTQDEILELVQAKVDNFGGKPIFNSLDDNRSGRVNVREFVDALQAMEVHITDHQAEDLFGNLNGKVGDEKREHLGFRAFANAFMRGVHEGTTGSDEGVIPLLPKAILWGKEGTTDHLQPAPSPRPPAHAKGNLAPRGRGRYAGSLGGGDGEELDSIQRFSSTRAPMELLESLPIDRGALYSQEISGGYDQMASAGHDQMSGWRDGRPVGGIGVGPQELGRGLDWFTHKRQETIALSARRIPDPEDAAQGILPDGSSGSGHGGAPGGKSRSTAAARRAAKALAEHKLALARAEAEAKKTDPAFLKSVAGSIVPMEGTPGYLSERERLTPREALWTSPESHLAKTRKAARLEASTQRYQDREARRKVTQLREQSEADRLESAKFAIKSEFSARFDDWQQVVESRENETGVQVVALEPAPSDNPLWAYAAPHRTSHWNTIAMHLHDPPSRVHVKPISAYRGAGTFNPEVEHRPPTPRHPVWGGDRDSLPAVSSPR